MLSFRFVDRRRFLSEVWVPYPVLPEGARYGRVRDILDGKLTLLTEDVVLDVVAKGDLSVLVAGDWVAVDEQGQFTLLAPNLGETQRSVDTSVLVQWSRFKDEVKSFFTRQNFLEVTTPGLVVCPGTEPSLDVFSTEWVHGSRRETRYLPTSPELHLKKALARGLPKIFEMKTCYRNGEISPHHRPEFTMLEWYRAGARPQAIAQDVIALVENCAGVFHKNKPSAVIQTTVAELFQKILNATLTPASSLEDYRQIAINVGLKPGANFTIDDLFFLIFIEKIEPSFDPNAMTFVKDWPPFQAALARLTGEGWGDRFEVYWKGLELANAFHELNDPQVQRARFQADLAKKKAMGKPAIPLDEEFLRHLDSGMPPSSGIALGVERLFMAMFGISSIAKLSLFDLGE